MGTNSLPKLAAAPTKVAATTTQYNAAVDAMQGHLVMRDSAGAVEDGVSDIGRPSSGRPRKVYVGTGLNVAGQDIDFSAIALQTTGVSSGLAKASGFPQFLEPGDETGAGGSHIVRILAADTPLEMTIDGQAYTLETDLESDALALAPGSNNTCKINDANIAVGDSKTAGEHGYWLKIDTVGSGITALNGTIQCFKTGTEVFLALVDTTNSKLIPLLRGIAGTSRAVLADDAVITLLKAHYIFLDDDLATISTTTNYPTRSGAEPSAPVEGDYWWDVANETWKRYSGASWEALGRIYLGYAIADASGVEWVEHVDFDALYDSTLQIKKVAIDGNSLDLYGPLNISVVEKRLNLISGKATIDITNSGNWESGEFANLASGVWFYLYCDKTGNFYISSKCPRNNPDKKGLYHPSEYWRCFGVFQAGDETGTASFEIQTLIFPVNSTVVSVQGYTQTILSTTNKTHCAIDLPPFIENAIVRVRASANFLLTVEYFDGGHTLIMQTERDGSTWADTFVPVHGLTNSRVYFTASSLGGGGSITFNVVSTEIKF